MPKYISFFLSAIFHPLLMPLFGLYIIFNSGYFASFPELKRNIYLMIFLGTVGLPLIFFSLLYNLRLIKNIYMENHKERVLPLFVITLLYLALFVFMRKQYFAIIIQSFMLSIALTTFLLMIISVFWKISLHMAGAGGLLGLIFSLAIQLKVNFLITIITIIIISGIVGSSRLSLGDHKPSQVYTGFFLGLIIVILTTLFYNFPIHLS